MVQWLRLCASNAGGVGSIPDQGIKILAGQKNLKKKKKKVTLFEFCFTWALYFSQFVNHPYDSFQ